MYKFCYVGRLVVRQKRVDLLSHFCAALQKNHIPFSLNVYGDGDASAIYDLSRFSQVNIKGFSKNWLEDVDNGYIFLSFSEYEGCPLSLLEFSKYVGNRFLARRVNGIKQYLSENCLFDDVDDAVEKLLNKNSFENYLSHQEYFTNRASQSQVDWLINNVF